MTCDRGNSASNFFCSVDVLTVPLVQVLAAGPFVVPLGLEVHTRLRRREQLLRQLFHSHMKWTVREEVVLADCILAVRVAADQRHHFFGLFRLHYDELHLDEDALQGDLAVALCRVEERRCRLAAVDDLQICDLADRTVSEVDARSSGADPVVVGEEVPRIFEKCLADSAVDLASDGQEGADVAFEKAAAVLAVQGSQQVPGNRRKVGRDITRTVLHPERGHSFDAPVPEVQLQGFASLARLVDLEEALQIPDMELDGRIADRGRDYGFRSAS